MGGREQKVRGESTRKEDKRSRIVKEDGVVGGELERKRSAEWYIAKDIFTVFTLLFS